MLRIYQILMILGTLTFQTLGAYEIKREPITLSDSEQLAHLWELGNKATNEEAYELAIQILEVAAIENTWQSGRYAQNRVIKNVLERLKRTKIKTLSPSSVNRFCSTGVMAYTLGFIGNEIILCAQSLQLEKEELAQVIIHEAAHLVMGGNECHVTQFEVIVMAYSPDKTLTKNGYWSQCRTEQFLEKFKLSL